MTKLVYFIVNSGIFFDIGIVSRYIRFGPVSYTHLDVYKRQGLMAMHTSSLSILNICSNISDALSARLDHFTHDIDLDSTDAAECQTVSYTHLDVYKRQPKKTSLRTNHHCD